MRGRQSLPTVIVIAGPNGAGKTTFAREYLSTERRFEFVNADEIARGLRTPSDFLAARIMLTRIDELIGADADFVIETTLANLTYAHKIPLWQEEGLSDFADLHPFKLGGRFSRACPQASGGRRPRYLGSSAPKAF